MAFVLLFHIKSFLRFVVTMIDVKPMRRLSGESVLANGTLVRFDSYSSVKDLNGLYHCLFTGNLLFHINSF